MEVSMLEELKQRVWQVAEDSMAERLVHERGGNFSIYDHDSGYVVITPSGVHRRVLKPEHIAVVDLDGKVVEGKMKPSSETPLHTGVYREMPEVGGIAHTHSTYATCFALLNREIPAILPPSLWFGGSIPVAPFAMPGSAELATTALPLLKHHSAVLMQKHGVLVIDKTVEGALLKAIYVEELAQVYHLALAVGVPTPWTEEEITAIANRPRI